VVVSEANPTENAREVVRRQRIRCEPVHAWARGAQVQTRITADPQRCPQAVHRFVRINHYI